MLEANKSATAIALYAKLATRISTITADCAKSIENEIETTFAQVKRIEATPEVRGPSECKRT